MKSIPVVRDGFFCLPFLLEYTRVYSDRPVAPSLQTECRLANVFVYLLALRGKLPATIRMTKTFRLIIFLTTSINFSFAQTEEEKRKIDAAVDTAISAYLKDPSKFQKYLDPKTINQFPDSGRIENGLKEGQWIEYSIDSLAVADNATLRVGDKTIPIKTSYFLQKELGTYDIGLRNGSWSQYKSYDTEAPFYFHRSSVKHFKNGQLDGEEIHYQGYGEDQRPLYTRQWKAGVENGIGRAYDYNYPYKIQQLYKVLEGKTVLLQTFYPSEQIEYEQTDTIINGKSLIFLKHFRENGRLEYTGYYLNEKEQYGTWTTYYENGKVESIKDKLTGNYKYYFDTGQICTERIYEGEKLMEVISNYSKKGEKNNPGTIKKGTGTLLLYYPDGKLKQSIEYVDGIEKK